MARPVTLFTGQWADLPLEVLAQKAKEFGYDGLELACWGDHFEVDKACEDKKYCDAKRATLDRYGLKVFAISNHLAGQLRQALLLFEAAVRSGMEDGEATLELLQRSHEAAPHLPFAG